MLQLLATEAERLRLVRDHLWKHGLDAVCPRLDTLDSAVPELRGHMRDATIGRLATSDATSATGLLIQQLLQAINNPIASKSITESHEQEVLGKVKQSREKEWCGSDISEEDSEEDSDDDGVEHGYLRTTPETLNELLARAPSIQSMTTASRYLATAAQYHYDLMERVKSWWLTGAALTHIFSVSRNLDLSPKFLDSNLWKSPGFVLPAVDSSGLEDSIILLIQYWFGFRNVVKNGFSLADYSNANTWSNILHECYHFDLEGPSELPDPFGHNTLQLRLLHNLRGDRDDIIGEAVNGPDGLSQVSKPSNGGYTALHLAAALGRKYFWDLSMDSPLASYTGIIDRKGWWPIWYAIHNGETNIFQKLCGTAKRALCEHQDRYGRTVAMVALRSALPIDDIRGLLKYSNLRSTDNKGESLLAYAIRSENIEAVRLLLSMKREDTIYLLQSPRHTARGESALQFALRRGAEDIALLLLQNPATSIPISVGKHPVIYALECECITVAEQLAMRKDVDAVMKDPYGKKLEEELRSRGLVGWIQTRL